MLFKEKIAWHATMRRKTRPYKSEEKEEQTQQWKEMEGHTQQWKRK
jgi:hypothetical protein